MCTPALYKIWIASKAKIFGKKPLCKNYKFSHATKKAWAQGMDRGSPVAAASASSSSTSLGVHNLPRGAAKRKGTNPVSGGSSSGAASAGNNQAIFNPVLMGGRGLSALLPTAAAASSTTASGPAGIEHNRI